MSSDERGRVALAVLAARDNIRLVQSWTRDRTLDQLKSDVLVRYAIERAFMMIDASVRDIPTDMIDAHGIPARLIAGFRNALAHTYDDILDERVMLTIRDDLPRLDESLRVLLEGLSTP